jgi:hypothetical protein
MKQTGKVRDALGYLVTMIRRRGDLLATAPSAWRDRELVRLDARMQRLAEDIAAAIGAPLPPAAPAGAAAAEAAVSGLQSPANDPIPHAHAIRMVLIPGPLGGAEIARRIGQPAETVRSSLGKLEVAGYITHNGQKTHRSRWALAGSVQAAGVLR